MSYGKEFDTIKESINEAEAGPWVSQLASMLSQAGDVSRVRTQAKGGGEAVLFSVRGTPFGMALQPSGNGYIVTNIRAQRQPKPSVVPVADGLAHMVGKTTDQIMAKQRGPWSGKVWDDPGSLAQAVTRVIQNPGG